jgi:uncharacterized protein
MRLRLAFLLALLVCIGSLAHADDDVKIAKAEEYFKLAKMDELMTQVMNQVIAQSKSGMMQQMMGAKLSPEEQQRVDELTDKAAKIVSGAMSWDKLEPEFAKLYAEAYTEQQLDDIIAFYKSPTGQAMVEKNPILIKKANAITQQQMAEVTPQLQKLMQDFMAEEIKRAAQEKSKQ